MVFQSICTLHQWVTWPRSLAYPKDLDQLVFQYWIRQLSFRLPYVSRLSGRSLPAELHFGLGKCWWHISEWNFMITCQLFYRFEKGHIDKGAASLLFCLLLRSFAGQTYTMEGRSENRKRPGSFPCLQGYIQDKAALIPWTKWRQAFLSTWPKRSRTILPPSSCMFWTITDIWKNQSK